MTFCPFDPKSEKNPVNQLIKYSGLNMWRPACLVITVYIIIIHMWKVIEHHHMLSELISEINVFAFPENIYFNDQTIYNIKPRL